MQKREVSRLLKAGLAYEHIAVKLKTTARKVSDFVKANMPDEARCEQGRVPAIVADQAFMNRFNREGAQAIADDLNVSLSAVYRAKYRFLKANG
jgi:hypothetical protein